MIYKTKYSEVVSALAKSTFVSDYKRKNKMGDRYNILSQMEHLQSKYMGTGHADTTKFEWAVHQHRDTFASLMGHTDLTNHLAISENESKARVKFNLLEKMLQPCGPPPEKKSED